MPVIYSFKKGLWKGIVSLLAVGGGLVAFMGFSDISIWVILETHLKPVLGSLTVGGIITILINWIKIKRLT